MRPPTPALRFSSSGLWKGLINTALVSIDVSLRFLHLCSERQCLKHKRCSLTSPSFVLFTNLEPPLAEGIAKGAVDPLTLVPFPEAQGSFSDVTPSHRPHNRQATERTPPQVPLGFQHEGVQFLGRKRRPASSPLPVQRNKLSKYFVPSSAGANRQFLSPRSAFPTPLSAANPANEPGALMTPPLGRAGRCTERASPEVESSSLVSDPVSASRYHASCRSAATGSEGFREDAPQVSACGALEAVRALAEDTGASRSMPGHTAFDPDARPVARREQPLASSLHSCEPGGTGQDWADKPLPFAYPANPFSNCSGKKASPADLGTCAEDDTAQPGTCWRDAEGTFKWDECLQEGLERSVANSQEGASRVDPPSNPFDGFSQGTNLGKRGIRPWAPPRVKCRRSGGHAQLANSRSALSSFNRRAASTGGKGPTSPSWGRFSFKGVKCGRTSSYTLAGGNGQLGSWLQRARSSSSLQTGNPVPAQDDAGVEDLPLGSGEQPEMELFEGLPSASGSFRTSQTGDPEGYGVFTGEGVDCLGGLQKLDALDRNARSARHARESCDGHLKGLGLESPGSQPDVKTSSGFIPGSPEGTRSGSTSASPRIRVLWGSPLAGPGTLPSRTHEGPFPLSPAETGGFESPQAAPGGFTSDGDSLPVSYSTAGHASDSPGDMLYVEQERGASDLSPSLEGVTHEIEERHFSGALGPECPPFQDPCANGMGRSTSETLLSDSLLDEDMAGALPLCSDLHAFETEFCPRARERARLGSGLLLDRAGTTSPVHSPLCSRGQGTLGSGGMCWPEDRQDSGPMDVDCDAFLCRATVEGSTHLADSPRTPSPELLKGPGVTEGSGYHILKENMSLQHEMDDLFQGTPPAQVPGPCRPQRQIASPGSPLSSRRVLAPSPVNIQEQELAAAQRSSNAKPNSCTTTPLCCPHEEQPAGQSTEDPRDLPSAVMRIQREANTEAARQRLRCESKFFGTKRQNSTPAAVASRSSEPEAQTGPKGSLDPASPSSASPLPVSRESGRSGEHVLPTETGIAAERDPKQPLATDMRHIPKFSLAGHIALDRFEERLKSFNHDE